MPLQSTISPEGLACLAWDLDNTLFDRDAAVRRFFDAWLGRKGHCTALETVMKLDCSGEGGRREFCVSVLRECSMDTAGAEELWQEFRRTLPDFVEPDRAVLQLLEQLAGRYEVALVSNGGSTLQRAKLARAGLVKWFAADRIFISEEAGSAKPDPAIFQRLLKATGLAPERVLFTGDHWVNDIGGAAALGLQTCWVARGRPRPADLPGLMVEHVRDLAPWLAEAALAA